MTFENILVNHFIEFGILDLDDENSKNLDTFVLAWHSKYNEMTKNRNHTSNFKGSLLWKKIFTFTYYDNLQHFWEEKRLHFVVRCLMYKYFVVRMNGTFEKWRIRSLKWGCIIVRSLFTKLQQFRYLVAKKRSRSRRNITTLKMKN